MYKLLVLYRILWHPYPLHFDMAFLLVQHEAYDIVLFLNAGASIQLKPGNFAINENGGPLRMCVEIISPNITCPIAFPFELRFVTTDITADI